jgi:hypothetical protein
VIFPKSSVGCSILAVVLCTGCQTTGPIPPDIRSVAVVDHVEGPSTLEYEDATSTGVMFLAVLGGYGSGIIASELRSSNQRAGLQKFAFLSVRQDAWVKQEVRRACEEELARSGFLRVNRTVTGSDAEVGIQDISFGYRHVGDQRFHLKLSVTYEMIRVGTEKTVREFSTTVESDESVSVAEFHADPARFNRIMALLARQAADRFRQNLSAAPYS